jgi:YD repeat-containing protein
MRISGLATFALVAAVVATGCGGGGNNSSPTSPTATSGGTSSTPNVVTITIKGVNGKLSFDPNPAAVAAGQLVAFKNADKVEHQITLDDNSQKTAIIAPGATSATLSVGGANASYHCAIHPSMVGSFNSAVTPDPPPCTGYCG